ncbi:MAG: DNA-processing protein DprA [Pseudomonadota bacterium]
MIQKELSHQERAQWLRLSRSSGIGPLTFNQLLTRYGTAEEAIKAIPKLSEKGKGGKRRIQLAELLDIERELDDSEALGVRLLAKCEPAYPALLRAIPDPPPVISVRGDIGLAKEGGVSLVGARNASAAGRRMTAELARELGDRGLTIVSGMARGIDGAAHQASLATGTVAVLAGGVDNVYPPQHQELYEEIVDRGCVLSEVKLGKVATARDVPRRNRIVSGLCRGVIVVEAAIRSGTLITARLALEQGREVFAVPGSPLDPRCEGTNKLIREGATLIRDVDDVMESLQQFSYHVEEHQPYEYDHDGSSTPSETERAALRNTLLEILSFTPTHRDILIRDSNAPPNHVADVLLDLVLSGEIEETSGGNFILSAD